FTVTPDGVRFGLIAIKNVGQGAIESMLHARDARGGRFKSLNELCEDLDLRLVNKRVLEALVPAGALDGMLSGGTTSPLRAVRPRLIAALDQAVERAARVQRDKELGQADLFHGGGETAEPASPATRLPEATPWTDMELLAAEKEALGLFWSGHPMDAHAADLEEIGARTIADLQGVDDGLEVSTEAGANGRPAAPAGHAD